MSTRIIETKMDIAEAISVVGPLAIEEWAMMLIEEVSEKPENLLSIFTDGYRARITFQGPTNGELSIICTKDFSDTLCQNLLGLDFDEEPSEEDRIDSLKEMTNLLTGNFVTTAFGDDVIFDLIMPEAESISVDDLQSDATYENFRYFLADDSGIGISVNLK